jgi:hypothetical protein
MDFSEDGAVATLSHPVGGCCYRPVVTGTVLQADGDSYAEFLTLDIDGVMVGLAHATFDPTVPITASSYIYGAYATPDGWMMEIPSGNFYHDMLGSGKDEPWVSGPSMESIEAGQTIGMHLHAGRLSVYIGGEQVGVMCEGLVGEFVWAADLSDGHDVRIQSGVSPGGRR